MDIIGLIETLGFPIVMCLILVVYIYKVQNKFVEQIQSMTEVLNNNTNVLQNLLKALDQVELAETETGDNDDE